MMDSEGGSLSGYPSSTMSPELSLAQRSILLEEVEFGALCNAIVTKARNDDMLGQEYSTMKAKSNRTSWLIAMINEVEQYRRLDVGREIFQEAIIAIFDEKNKELIKDENTQQAQLEIRRVSEHRFSLRDIFIVILRLGTPKLKDHVNALDLVPDGTKARLPLCNITGTNLDAELWWKSMILDSKSFNEATEEVVYYTGFDHDDSLPVLDTKSIKQGLSRALNEALYTQQTMIPFLIRPKDSLEGEAQLVAASRYKNKAVDKTILNGPKQIIKVQEHSRTVGTIPNHVSSLEAQSEKGDPEDMEGVIGPTGHESMGGVGGLADPEEAEGVRASRGSENTGEVGGSTSLENREVESTVDSLPDNAGVHATGATKYENPAAAATTLLTLSSGAHPTPSESYPSTAEEREEGNGEEDELVPANHRRPLHERTQSSEEIEDVSPSKRRKLGSNGNDDITISTDSDDEIADQDKRSNVVDDDVIEDIEFDVGDNEDMIENLKHAPVCSQFTEELWQECCELFRHDPEKKLRADRFHLAGLSPGMTLHNYQAFGITWIAKRILNPIAPGCILADEMGLGKTMQILGLICLLRELSLAWGDVKAYWGAPPEAQDGRHLLRNTENSGQEKGSRCPSQRDPATPGISCPCVVKSLSHKLAKKLRPGPWLIFVPPKNIFGWQRECQKVLNLHDPRMKFEYMIAHSLRTLSMQQRASIANNPVTLKGTMEQGRLIVISSSQSFYNKVVNGSLRRENASGRRTRKSDWEVDHPFSWGYMVHDEFHEAKNPKTMANMYFQQARNWHPSKKATLPSWDGGNLTTKDKLLRDKYPEGQVTPHPSNPLRIGLSGTPIEGSPEDIKGFVLSWADMAEWAKAGSGFQHCTVNKLDDLTKGYKKVVSELQKEMPTPETKAKIEDYMEKLTEVLRSLMIKRRGSDKFFGEPIVDIPPMKINRHECPLKPEYQPDVALLATKAHEEALQVWKRETKKWREGGKQGAAPILGSTRQQKMSSTAFYLRLCAGFPAIARLQQEHPDWLFTASEYSKIRDNLSRHSLYKTHLQTLLKGSSKIEKLEVILADMIARSKDNEKRGETRAKGLILASSPAHLAILKLYFEGHSPSSAKFVVIDTPMSFNDRNNIVDGFCNRRDENGKPIHRAAEEADILLSQISLMKSGFNLQKAADTVVLFGPDFTMMNQDQAFCRVHRQGQGRPTNLHLLFDPANPIERGIISRQDARGTMSKMTWHVSVQLAGSENAKKEDGHSQIEA